MVARRPGPRNRAFRSAQLASAASLLVACASFAPVRAHAEESREVRVDTVEVTAAAEDTPPPEPTVAEEPTGFGTVIETRDFDGQKLDVAELILQAPGARIHHAPGGKTLMLRGASSDQSLVFLDGIALNASAGGGVDLRTVPASLLERITVLRGNEGARYGAGALGGVALLETRELRGESGGSVSLAHGSFGTWDLSGAAWGGGEAASGLAAVTLRRTDGDYPAEFDPTRHNGPADTTYDPLVNNDERGGGALLKGRLALGADAEVHGLLHGWLGERGMPGTLYFPDDHRRDERRLVAALRVEGSPDADVRLGAGVSLRHDEVAVWSPTPAKGVLGQPAADGAGKPWQIENAAALRIHGEAAPVSWNLVRAEAELGGDWLDSPYHGSHQRERIALGVSDEIYLGSSITLAPAARWDRIGDAEGLSPRVGIAWRPTGILELRANWGRTFRAPSYGELFFEQGLVKSNPDLQPELGWTGDTGVVLRFPGAMLQLTGFYSRTENLIIYEITGPGTSKPVNLHDAEVLGGEIEALYHPLRWLTLSAGYSLTRTRNLRDDPRYLGNELFFRPPHRIHGRAAAREGDYEAFLEGSHQSAQYINRANTDSLPGGTVLRAGAGYRITEVPWAIWLSAQVDNAFDALMRDQLGFPQPGRAFTVTLRALSPESGARHPEEFP